MGKVLGLTARQCSPEGAQLLDELTQERLRQQVPGWRVQAGASAGLPTRIRQEWSCKDADAAGQLLQRMQDVSQRLGHAIAAADAVSSLAFVELTSPAAGAHVQMCAV